jgi:hypothetical protein
VHSRIGRVSFGGLESHVGVVQFTDSGAPLLSFWRGRNRRHCVLAVIPSGRRHPNRRNSRRISRFDFVEHQWPGSDAGPLVAHVVQLVRIRV